MFKIITHLCGHKERQSIRDDVDYDFKEWLESSYCSKCRYELAREENEGFPELFGTKKQIIWAENIRARIKKEAENSLRVFSENEESDLVELASSFLFYIRSIKSTTDWINLKDCSFGVDYFIDRFNKEEESSLI